MSDHLLGRFGLPLLALMLLAALSACSASGDDDTGARYESVRGDLCERLRISTLIEPDSIEIKRMEDDSDTDGTSAHCNVKWADESAEGNVGSVAIRLEIYDSVDDARQRFEHLDSTPLALPPDNWAQSDERTSTKGWWTKNSTSIQKRDDPDSARARQRRFQLYLDENLVVTAVAFHDLATPAPWHTRMEVDILEALLQAVPEQVLPTD